MSLTLIPAGPPVPDSSIDEPTFDAQFEASLTWQRDQLVPGINAVLPAVDAALTASEGTIAAAHYKGPWSTLTGPLAIPATVTHGAGPALYMLLESVADVTLEVPGVSAKWRSLELQQNIELISTVNAVGVASVEWTNFDTLAADYIELQVIGSNILSDAAGRQLTCQVRINNAFQTTSFSGQVIGGASHTQVNTAMSAASSLHAQANAPMDLRMVFDTLGVTAYARAKYETVERNTIKMVVGVAEPSGTPTTAIQGVRILGSAGTITGTFKLYGVRQ